mgnify:CR=1 FL=1
MKAVLAALLLVCTQAFAQADYPNKPVRLVVSFAAGGISDVLARALAIPLGLLISLIRLYAPKPLRLLAEDEEEMLADDPKGRS